MRKIVNPRRCSSTDFSTSCASGCIPLFVGDTGPDDLLQRHARSASFDLVDTSRLENGVVILSYQVSAADGNRK